MAAVAYRLRGWVAARWRAVGVLAVVVGVTVGVVLLLVAGTVRTITAPTRYEQSWGAGADITLQQERGPARTDELLSLPSVASVDLATFVFGGMQRGAEALDGLVFVGGQGAFGTRLVEGHLPDDAHPSQFAATRDLADAAGLQLGDHLDLLTFTADQAAAAGFATDPAGPVIDATLVGVLDGPGVLNGDFGGVTLFPASLLDEGDIGIAATVGNVDLRPGATIGDLRRDLDQLEDPELLPDRARARSCRRMCETPCTRKGSGSSCSPSSSA